MHDREFEKQVQQKMQELRFQPGADVWARVQADIQKKRRRRPVLLWLLLGSLLIGSAWILYSTNRSSDQQAVAKKNPSENNTKNTPENNITNHSPESEQNDHTNTQSKPAPDNTANTSPGNNTPGNTAPAYVPVQKASIPAEKTRNIAEKVSTKHQQATEKPAGHIGDGRRPVESSDTRKDPPVAITQPQKDIIVVDSSKADQPITAQSKISESKTERSGTDGSGTGLSETGQAKTGQTKTGSDQTKTGETKTDSDQNKADQAKAGQTDQTKTDQLPTKNETAKVQSPLAANETAKVQSPAGPSADSLTTEKPGVAQKKNNGKQNNNWQWGFSAGAGISDLGMQLFQSTTVADFANAYPQSGGVNTVPRRPSDVKPGISFNAGGYVSRSIGKQLRLKLGLNYEYYSNNILTGEFIDSSKSINQGAALRVVPEYYQSGSSNKYSNGYHFVSLPLSLQWRLNKHPKYGLVWENGISVSRLLHTNALHFDGIGGTYYSDNSVFRKTQVMVGSALLFDIKTKSGVQLYIGPQIQYGVSNMMQNDADNNKHMRYAGLKMMIGFNKN